MFMTALSWRKRCLFQMVLIMGGKHCCVEGYHNNNQKSKSTGISYMAFQKNFEQNSLLIHP